VRQAKTFFARRPVFLGDPLKRNREGTPPPILAPENQTTLRRAVALVQRLRESERAAIPKPESRGKTVVTLAAVAVADPAGGEIRCAPSDMHAARNSSKR